MGQFIVEFDLKTKSPLTVEDGDVIVDKGYRTVTVRNVEADSTDDAENKARREANAFLDELCLQYGISLEVGSGLAVGPQDSPATRHIKKYFMKVSTRGGHRERIPSKVKEVSAKASNSKAYYRKASISKDTFDKFRNLYLAIEHVASKVAAAKVKGTLRDSKLIELALRECFSSTVQSLDRYLPVRDFVSTGDTIRDVAGFLFKTHRCEVNHSKLTESTKVPYVYDDEWDVQVAIPITEFIAKSLIAYEDAHLIP
ncbi:MAG: hypothetical protein H8E40_14160 [Chloroflexi bacterium]|nr:hypothetical protein [Chloroflexota bacterium]